MITMYIPDRLKNVIVSVSTAKLIPLGFPRRNCNQRVSPRTVTFLENEFGKALKNVIVIFRTLIPENKNSCM